MVEMSLIVSVLDSHEVVRRQLLHLGRLLPNSCELILVDDGSEPPLDAVCAAVSTLFPLRLHKTEDRRPWTQPRGRNVGAALARGPKLLFFDIDHVVTESVLRACLEHPGDKLHWVRRPGVLDPEGRIVTDPETLRTYGLTDDRPSVHANSFMIRRTLFERLGGYDERYCGRYGGDDVDFNARYAALVARGLARPEDVSGEGFVYPDPAADARGLFHRLSRAVV